MIADPKWPGEAVKGILPKSPLTFDAPAQPPPAQPPPAAPKTNDPTAGTWLVTGRDGDNRHTVRQAISLVPRSVRLEKKGQMQHRRDVAHLRQHPLAGLQDHPERTAIRNALRRRRQGRTRRSAVSS